MPRKEKYRKLASVVYHLLPLIIHNIEKFSSVLETHASLLWTMWGKPGLLKEEEVGFVDLNR